MSTEKYFPLCLRKIMQFRVQYGSRHDNLETLEFTVYILLAQCFLSFVGLLNNRGHRLPYFFLFLALYAALVSNWASIIVRAIVGENVSPIAVGDPRGVISLLVALVNFTEYWSQVLLYVSIVCAMHDRITACDTALPTQSNVEEREHRRVLWRVHGSLIFLLLGFGTASAVTLISVIRSIELRKWTPPDGIRRLRLANYLYLGFASAIVLTMLDIILLAFCLRRKCRDINLRDKIATFSINVVTPLYILLTLLFIYSNIAHAPDVPTWAAHAFLRTSVTHDVLRNSVQVLLVSPIILFGFSRKKWTFPMGSPASRYIPLEASQVEHLTLRTYDDQMT